MATKCICTKAMDHPLVGEMTLNWDMFAHAGDVDQQLVLWSVEPGTASHEALRLLGTWPAPEHTSTPVEGARD